MRCVATCVGKVALKEVGITGVDYTLEEIAEGLAWEFGKWAVSLHHKYALVKAGFESIVCTVDCGCSE